LRYVVVAGIVGLLCAGWGVVTAAAIVAEAASCPFVAEDQAVFGGNRILLHCSLNTMGGREKKEEERWVKCHALETLYISCTTYRERERERFKRYKMRVINATTRIQPRNYQKLQTFNYNYTRISADCAGEREREPDASRMSSQDCGKA
jgi:hypothetical protein